LWCTPRAEQAISRIAPGWHRSDNALPPAIRDAVARLLTKRDVVGTSIRFEESDGPGAVEMVVIAHYRENEVLIRLNEVNPEQDVAKLRDRQQLTQREAEVLLWVSYGKSSSDISDVLEISPRTVQKHLERIYEKLGVETRSAAAAIAIRAIEQ
ncbi:MAG: LuxR family transcriptional regulator, partial [Sphingomonadales bacterium]